MGQEGPPPISGLRAPRRWRCACAPQEERQAGRRSPPLPVARAAEHLPGLRHGAVAHAQLEAESLPQGHQVRQHPAGPPRHGQDGRLRPVLHLLRAAGGPQRQGEHHQRHPWICLPDLLQDGRGDGGQRDVLVRHGHAGDPDGARAGGAGSSQAGLHRVPRAGAPDAQPLRRPRAVPPPAGRVGGVAARAGARDGAPRPALRGARRRPAAAALRRGGAEAAVHEGVLPGLGRGPVPHAGAALPRARQARAGCAAGRGRGGRRRRDRRHGSPAAAAAAAAQVGGQGRQPCGAAAPAALALPAALRGAEARGAAVVGGGHAEERPAGACAQGAFWRRPRGVTCEEPLLALAPQARLEGRRRHAPGARRPAERARRGAVAGLLPVEGAGGPCQELLAST
mmetsp:Transcript_44760/g.120608  ORF Transcript_44760/g.120608 Transcript_44760/m.120608 type:complete len:396 (+) Transcript_44760:424-1611(+)